MITLSSKFTSHCSTQIKQVQTVEQGISQDSKVTSKRALLTNGLTIETELILLAIGVEPCNGLITGLRDSNHRGLVVNHKLQSADPNIFAAGDCAELCVDPTIFERIADSQSLIQHNDPYVSGTWYEAKAMGQVVAHSMHQANQLENIEPSRSKCK